MIKPYYIVKCTFRFLSAGCSYFCVHDDDNLHMALHFCLHALNKLEQKEVRNNVFLRNVEIHPQSKRDSKQEEAFETRQIVDEIFKELKIKDKMGGFFGCKRNGNNRTKKPPAIELRFFTQLGVDLLFDSLGERSKFLKLSVVRAIPHYLVKFRDKAKKCAYDYRNEHGGRTKIKVIEDELVVMGKKLSAKDLITLELFRTIDKSHRSLKN